MAKFIIGVCVSFLLTSCTNIFIKNHPYGISEFEAFTHPYSMNPQIIYNQNGQELLLNSDEEGGWIVHVLKKNKQYFMVRIDNPKFNAKDVVKINKGELGVVIQNPDNNDINLYLQPSFNSKIICVLNKGYVGSILDIRYHDYSKCFVKLKIQTELDVVIGWVPLKYICGSPYTTCPWCGDNLQKNDN